MDAKPEELRREIEATRTQLGADLDELAEKLSPGRVAARRASDAKAVVSDLAARVSTTTNELRPKVVEGAHRAKMSTGATLGSVRERAEHQPQLATATSRARESADHAAQAVKDRLDAHPQVSARAQQAKAYAAHASCVTSERAKANPATTVSALTLGALLLVLLFLRHRRHSETDEQMTLRIRAAELDTL